MWCIALRTTNLAKRGKRVNNPGDGNETRMIPEKRLGGEISGKLSPMDLAKSLWARNGKIRWTSYWSIGFSERSL